MLYTAGKLMQSTTRVMGNVLYNLSSNKVLSLLWKLRNARRLANNIDTHAQLALSSLFIFAHCYRSTVYNVASKKAYLATELDRARGCNLEGSNLADVIAVQWSREAGKAVSSPWS